MEHDEALDALHLAAVEPGGLDRVMAGDTPQAAAVAGHLAGCPACATELERLRRAVPMLQDVVRTTPPADLRERTLAFVRERGVPRGAAAAPLGSADAAPALAEASAPPPAVVAGDAVRSPRSSVLPWLGAIAAAVVVSVVASTLIVGARVDEQLAAQERAIAGLEAVTTATLEVTAQPDVQRVSLVSADGSDAVGSLVFSAASTELVVVATGLVEPPDGKEYRCWVLTDGRRQPVGKMYVADDLAYWAGDTPEVADLIPGSTFGVSLADVGGGPLDAPPVIVGEL